MDRSISFTRDKASKKRDLVHNNRRFKNEKHIDRSLIKNNILYGRNREGQLQLVDPTEKNYEYVADENYEKNTIDKLFSKRVAAYNSSQKGNRRRIQNGMYEHLKNLTTKRGGINLERELLVGVGSKEDYQGMSDNEIEKEIDLRKRVIDKAVRGFGQRYPQLKITQAHLHCDELDKKSKKPHLRHVNPHAHIDFVPFPDVEFSKSGKPKKPSASMNKALLQMFPNDQKDSDKAFEDFTEDFRQYMDALILEEDPTYKRKHVGTYEYKSVNEYKEFKDKETELNEQQKLLDEQQIRMNAQETALRARERRIEEEAKEKYREARKKAQKDVLGVFKETLIDMYEDVGIANKISSSFNNKFLGAPGLDPKGFKKKKETSINEQTRSVARDAFDLDL